MENDAIGIFDSGIGGLTVMRQIIQDMPNENTIYFGDTARLPYGGKSQETILRYSIENAIFLMEKKIKLLIIACNTADAMALARLRQIFNVPIIGVIEPGVEEACRATKNQVIAVLGTKGTIQSTAYQKSLLTHMPEAKILAIPCPLLVHLVEEKYFDHPASKIIVEDYLSPIKDQCVDTIILGCTHYPLLSHLFRQTMGSQVALIDSGVACALKIKQLLYKMQLNAPIKQLGTHQFYVSDDPEKFRSLGQTFLGRPIASVTLVNASFS
jgi:glutamate racemase